MIGSGLGSGGFVLLDETRSIPRVAQTLARFLYVESCNQCTACKHGLQKASSVLDGLFDPEGANADDLERALYGARSAPQGNRCYLPVQGSVLIPNLINRFRAEFEAQLGGRSEDEGEYTLPLIVDYDEQEREFVYDSVHAYKRPDWTYDLPEADCPSKRSSAADTPIGTFGLRLEPDVMSALRARSDETGEALDRIANRILREGLAPSGEDG
jgi:hypothetical protein